MPGRRAKPRPARRSAVRWRITLRGPGFHRECRVVAASKNEALAKGEALLRKVEPSLFLPKLMVKLKLKCHRADVVHKL